jgi:hypothetical protein
MSFRPAHHHLHRRGIQAATAALHEMGTGKSVPNHTVGPPSRCFYVLSETAVTCLLGQCWRGWQRPLRTRGRRNPMGWPGWLPHLPCPDAAFGPSPPSSWPTQPWTAPPPWLAHPSSCSLVHPSTHPSTHPSIHPPTAYHPRHSDPGPFVHPVHGTFILESRRVLSGMSWLQHGHGRKSLALHVNPISLSGFILTAAPPTLSDGDLVLKPHHPTCPCRH